ncbi:PREDICTED: putative methyltransferase DDB_G0268948 [Fragaria vesca subsp. vesca]|uniref:putative methyltransferase DDB_G0268948 n=1 Tax=Fragaria vesca subsp. vesca TaxID=101020 RepID=UPI0002C3047C|nr:PREDICTED: putative methyltransferase DDB_G0268948 [Fragaria vesca subsp. vesca]
MADLFLKQSKQYAVGRPGYPEKLFQFIASKAPAHDLAWDVGTGTGQAARSLAEIYKNVVATDTSQTQLECAPKLPNVRYVHTSAVLTIPEIEQKVLAPKSSVDLVTIAQALHWFDLPSFYEQVKWVLKKPNGVIAAWCYTLPRINNNVDTLFGRFYSIDVEPYWEPPRKLVDNKYSTIDFPFEPVSGEGSTGPFEFAAETLMGLDDFFTYLRSWSGYQTAKDKGVELLNEDVMEQFKQAWNVDGGDGQKVVNYTIYLRIGRVGN